MAASLSRTFSSFLNISSVPFRTCSVLSILSYSLPFSSKSRDFSLPNSSWNSEMKRLYEHYNSQCEVESEDGQKQKGLWMRLPSYNRSLKFATGGVYLSKLMQSKARLFTRNIKEPGAAFEYVLFLNQEEHKCVGIFQAGHLLEGPPGNVHGGAIATMIDTVTGTHAALMSGSTVTANLNINYRRKLPFSPSRTFCPNKRLYRLQPDPSGRNSAHRILPGQEGRKKNLHFLQSDVHRRLQAAHGSNSSVRVHQREHSAAGMMTSR